MYVIDEIKLEQFQKLLAISEIDWVTIDVYKRQVYGMADSGVPEENEFIQMFSQFLSTCDKYVGAY